MWIVPTSTIKQEHPDSDSETDNLSTLSDLPGRVDGLLTESILYLLSKSFLGEVGKWYRGKMLAFMHLF